MKNFKKSLVSLMMAGAVALSTFNMSVIMTNAEAVAVNRYK